MKKFLLTLLVLSPFFSYSQADTTTQKNQEIKKLMILTGVVDMARTGMNQMIQQMKKTPNPNLPEGFFDEFMKEIKDEDLLNMYAPIYGRHYSLNEIKQLNKFYESPIGKKVIRETPALMTESIAAGSVWGREIGERVMKRMKKN